MPEKDAEEIKKYVRKRYGGLARQQMQSGGKTSCCGPRTSCCGPGTTASVTPSRAEALYGRETIQELPESVTGLALGCGDPTALADLKPGEVVLDLGSGGGIDCFIAARKVGAKGRVIGLDMTPDMLSLARENAKKLGMANVEFRLGEMEHMPVESNSVDIILSNCVINLSPDKDAVFCEAFRVLKPGGRLCVSDIVLLGELPEEVKGSLEDWAHCVAGALRKDDYMDKMRAAGFAEVKAESKSISLCLSSGDALSAAVSDHLDDLRAAGLVEVKAESNGSTSVHLSDVVVSAAVTAVKPR